jgi:mRNA interferase MazF
MIPSPPSMSGHPKRTGLLMPGFDVWDVVRVPFPYTDRPIREYRPALVIGAGGIEKDHGLLWVLMITSSSNRGWPGDVEVSNLEVAGLPAASVFRTAKIAIIECKEANRIESACCPPQIVKLSACIYVKRWIEQYDRRTGNQDRQEGRINKKLIFQF